MKTVSSVSQEVIDRVKSSIFLYPVEWHNEVGDGIMHSYYFVEAGNDLVPLEDVMFNDKNVHDTLIDFMRRYQSDTKKIESGIRYTRLAMMRSLNRTLSKYNMHGTASRARLFTVRSSSVFAREHRIIEV